MNTPPPFATRFARRSVSGKALYTQEHKKEFLMVKRNEMAKVRTQDQKKEVRDLREFEERPKPTARWREEEAMS